MMRQNTGDPPITVSMDERPQQITRDILDSVRAGDDSAARQLIDMLYPVVISIVRNHLPRTEMEEDLCQEIFLKVFGKLGQFRDRQPFQHWVSRIALNTCYDRLRRQKKRQVLGFTELELDEIQFIESVGDEQVPRVTEGGGSLARELLEKLLGSLKPRERMVVQLLDLEENSVAEVCELTGWGASKVRVTAMRARRKLAETLARIEGDAR
jgi:RNA polymerase sigma-70 factor (ECF subfamily)